MLDEPLGLLDDHVGDLYVTICRFVECGGNDFRIDVLLHVRDLFRSFIDQQDNECHIGRRLPNRVGHLLQQDRLPGLRRRDDQSSLAQTDRREDIDDPAREVTILRLQGDASVGIPGLQVIERDPVFGIIRFFEIDFLDLEQGEIPLALLGGANLPEDRIAGSQVETLDLARTDVDVVGAVQIIPILTPQEPVSLGEDFQNPFASEHRVGIEEGLLDLEDEILLAEAGVVGDVQLIGHLMQVRDGLAFKLGDVHGWGLHQHYERLV